MSVGPFAYPGGVKAIVNTSTVTVTQHEPVVLPKGRRGFHIHHHENADPSHHSHPRAAPMAEYRAWRTLGHHQREDLLHKRAQREAGLHHRPFSEIH